MHLFVWFLHFLHLFVLVFAFYQVGEVADRDGSGCRVVGETSLHSLLVGSIPEEKKKLKKYNKYITNIFVLPPEKDL